MDNRIVHTAALEARRARGLSSIAAREASQLGIHLSMPIANTAHILAQQLGHANLNLDNTNRTDKSFALLPFLVSVYLPSSSYMELTRLVMPDEKNPIIQLENAETTEELIACHAGLENLLGRNQTGKLEMLSTDANDRAAFPARMIRSFLRVAPLAPQEYNELPNNEQREGVNVLATYLAEYIGSHPLCSDITKHLGANEAVLFLERASQPNQATTYNRVVSHARQELALRAVKEDGTLLRTLPHDLQNNIQVVQQAIIETADAFQFASYDLQTNPNIIKIAGYRCGALHLAGPIMESDTNCPLIVKAAVRYDGKSLQFVSMKLRGDYDIVLAAVEQHPWALAYASNTLRNNHGLALTAIKQHGWALQFASDELRNNHDIVLNAVIQDGWSIKFASDTLRNDFSIARTAVTQKSWLLKHVGDRMKNNHEVVMAAVQRDGLALQFASDELKSNRDIVSAAIQQNHEAFRYANQALLNDNEDFRIAAQQASI